MGVMKVDVAGLQSLADGCHELADELTDSSPPTPVGKPFQPTVSAVNAVHASVRATAEVLATRMTDSASKLANSAAAYADRDENSAQKVRAAAATVEA